MRKEFQLAGFTHAVHTTHGKFAKGPGKRGRESIITYL